ncbi:MAG: endo-1,4-beta-xylanase [Planctomycetes bacterium]|nr:endo-1,4-beta-xylanase [Planctomycetota bacterium]
MPLGPLSRRRFLTNAAGAAAGAAVVATAAPAVLAAPRGAPRAASYDGRDASAAWREAAHRRIDQHRKADLAVTVTDADGKPLPGAQVTVAMRRHAFGFGSAVAADCLVGERDDHKRYRETVRTSFSKVVFENDLKWPQWEDPANRARTLKALDWLEGEGIVVRGHCLVWPSWRRMPGDVAGLKDDEPALRRRIAGHVRDEVSALKGRIADWDVINEPFWNHDAMDVLGQDAMVEWFKTARAADPATVLYLNDQNILAGGGTDAAHQDHYERTARYLVDQGAPLGGLGMQCHFGGNLTPPERMLALLDRFAAFNLPIQITEFDINTSDRDLQADYFRDFLTAAFSHPQVAGIVMWGFWAGRHWKPEAALFERDWTLRPHGQAWRDLVLGRWWTRASGPADARGRFAARGFLGTYEVTGTAGGRTKTVPAALGQDGATVTVRLD